MPTVEEGASYPRELEYEGLPPGWKAVERAYTASSKFHGTTYIRFNSPCGKYKQVGSVKSVWKTEYEKQGLDPADGEAHFNELKLKEKQRKEEEGQVSGEKKEEAVQTFEAKYGKLEAAVVPKIPGWSYKAKYLENSGQTHILYYDPKGTQYGTVKAVEAVFGMKLLRGEDCSFIDVAREAFIAEHGSLDPGYNPLRRSADGSTLQECAASGDFSKIRETESMSTLDDDKLKALREQHGSKKKRRRRIVDILESDYSEFATLVVKQCSSSSETSSSVEVLQRTSTQVAQLLQKRGFGDVQLLAVCSTVEGHCHVDEIAGVYYKLPEPFEGRPCFQWVKMQPDNQQRLVCSRMYIHWSETRSRWQIGRLGGDSNCVLFNTENVPVPWDIKQPWMAIRADFR